MGLLSLIGILLATGYALLLQRSLLAWNRLPEWRPPPNFTPSLSISVLIPARNEAAHIGRLLDSLARQDYPPNLFETIVIDDHSEDGTAAIAEARPLPGLRVLRLAGTSADEGKSAFGKKKALEYGVARARGELIITTDADCELPPSWLRMHASCREQTSAVIIAAPVLFSPARNTLERFQALDFAGMMALAGAGISGRFLYLANGANLAFAKDTFLEVGGYEGNRQYASGDDMFLMQKIARRYPEKVFFLKSRAATVNSLPQPGLKAFIGQRLRWGTKNKSFGDWRVTLALGLVFTYCWFIIALLPAILFFGIYAAGLLLGLLLVKGFADYLFLSSAVHFFRRPSLLKGFWRSELMHILYFAGIGLLSLFVRRFSWKGRKVQ